MFAQVALEPRHVDADRAGVADEVPILQRSLVLEQRVVHLPEVSLRRARFGRLGGVPRVWMLGARKVPEDETEPIGGFTPNPFHHRGLTGTEGALAITVLDQSDRGVGRPQHVVSFGINRWTQLRRCECAA